MVEASVLRWHYIFRDGNPKKSGYYQVAIEESVTYADDSWTDDPDEVNRIVNVHGGGGSGVCYFDAEKGEWIFGSGTLRFDDCDELCDSDHIYAWADVFLPRPKELHEGKDVTVNPADYHLTEAQLMDFLQDYKRSYERGDAFE